jgi:hypothetical protein
MGAGIKFTVLKNPRQCSHRPSGRYMLEAGRILRSEEAIVVGGETFEYAFGMNFVVRRLHYDEMERHKQPIRMLYSSFNRTSKIINHISIISIIKLIKLKLFRKIIIVYFDKKN